LPFRGIRCDAGPVLDALVLAARLLLAAVFAVAALAS
jgi:hypothetical protein